MFRRIRTVRAIDSYHRSLDEIARVAFGGREDRRPLLRELLSSVMSDIPGHVAVRMLSKESIDALAGIVFSPSLTALFTENIARMARVWEVSAAPQSEKMWEASRNRIARGDIRKTPVLIVTGWIVAYWMDIRGPASGSRDSVRRDLEAASWCLAEERLIAFESTVMGDSGDDADVPVDFAALEKKVLFEIEKELGICDAEARALLKKINMSNPD